MNGRYLGSSEIQSFRTKFTVLMQSTNKRTNEQTIKCARYRCVIHFLGERIKCDLLCYCLHRFTCCTRIDSNSPFNILRWSVGLLFLSIVLFEFSEQILFFFLFRFVLFLLQNTIRFENAFLCPFQNGGYICSLSTHRMKSLNSYIESTN